MKHFFKNFKKKKIFESTAQFKVRRSSEEIVLHWNTAGARISNTFGFWMVESCWMLICLDFKWHSKSQQNGSHFEFYHLKTQFIKHLDFKCVQILNLRYSTPVPLVKKVLCVFPFAAFFVFDHQKMPLFNWKWQVSANQGPDLTFTVEVNI